MVLASFLVLYSFFFFFVFFCQPLCLTTTNMQCQDFDIRILSLRHGYIDNQFAVLNDKLSHYCSQILADTFL